MGALLGLVTALGTAAAWGLDARRRAHRAALVHRTMVQLLLNTLATGDPATARHSRRVAALTDQVARTYHLGREVRARLRIAALLHDVGKIDDHLFPLVHSSRRLDRAERTSVQKHTNQSAAILEPLEAIHPGIGRIVESHHERWDGKGYPRRIAGREIPLESRIISAADVFDALTQPRSYREPLEPEKVLAILRAEAGSRFDPGVVERVQRAEVWGEWMEIVRQGRQEEVRHRTPEATAEP